MGEEGGGGGGEEEEKREVGAMEREMWGGGRKEEDWKEVDWKGRMKRRVRRRFITERAVGARGEMEGGLIGGGAWKKKSLGMGRINEADRRRRRKRAGGRCGGVCG